MHHTSNGIALRRDLRHAFDAGVFAIVPRGGDWVVHFFDSACLLAKEYDGKIVMLSNEVSRKCLLVKFAEIVFSLVKDFVEQGEGASRVRKRL